MAVEQAERAGFRVRLAEPRDVPALARVHVESWHAAYTGIISPQNLAATTQRRSLVRFRGYFVSGGQERSLMQVLEDDSGVVGYANSGVSYSNELGARGEVFELYLLPEAQGRGGGRKLLSAALWSLSAWRLMPVIVWALADNHRARRFYLGMRGRELAHGSTRVGDQRLARVGYLWSDYLPWPEFL